MFNDPLDMAQCNRIVDDLARTHLPFQCAHGRPSIVPISNLSTQPVGRLPTSAADWASFVRDQINE
jgi:DNA mismatch repair protein MLH3